MLFSRRVCKAIAKKSTISFIVSVGPSVLLVRKVHPKCLVQICVRI